MNNNSLGLMTYCSLAKGFTGIKNSTNLLKYSIFFSTFTMANNLTQFLSLSQMSLNSREDTIQTQTKAQNINLKLIK